MTQNWRTSSDDPEVVKPGQHYFKPMTIEVDAGTGTVQVQRLQSDGTTWVAIEEEGTLDASGVYVVQRANGPALRIAATGDAKYNRRGL